MTTPANHFVSLFERATENAEPLPYQKRLAFVEPFPTLLDVPTGLGKTAAAVLAWVWRRRFADRTVRETTPRRLVYCLPMRVLVEQSYTETVKWLTRLGLLAGTAEWAETDVSGLPTKQARLKQPETGKTRGYRADPGCEELSGWASSNGDQGKHPIAVHLLLGGEEKSDWALWPERDAILIGTQDMLLSRAMHRGYAAGRARWPLEFGFLNSDCLWVFDEVQIMDTGLASSLQLDAWRQSLSLRPARGQFPKATTGHISRPCRSLWMSATMARHWLERAVDWAPRAIGAWEVPQRVRLGEHALPDGTVISDDGSKRVQELFANPKKLLRAELPPEGKKKKGTPVVLGDDETPYLKLLAKLIIEKQAKDGLTLVILNTVDRARRLYELLPREQTKLIHSRFRPGEREGWSAFLRHEPGKPRIIVSTQVVEAGVDLSAAILFTELAPWASLIQRFGRCARYPGESGFVYWIDIIPDERAAPYTAEELNAAREQLSNMTDVGLQTLKDLRPQLDIHAETLFPYEPRFIPHDKDLFDLFDTTPDLTGADVDISRFIRDGEELDVQVFWRELPSGTTPLKKDRPQRRELCPVPFLRFRELLPTLRKQGGIWRRNYRRGWEPVGQRDANHVYPGQVFMLEKSCGGYDRDLGWTGSSTSHSFDVFPPVTPAMTTVQDDEEDADDLSQINAWLSVEAHTRDVCVKLAELLPSAGLPEATNKILRLAARLHDWGKAHLAFQAKLVTTAITQTAVEQKLNQQPAAKAPDLAWRTDKIHRQMPDTPEADKDRRRPGFRHELASALAILEMLYRAKPDHPAFAWPEQLNKAEFSGVLRGAGEALALDDPLLTELVALTNDELDLLVYLVAAHHGKVRMGLRSSPDDERDDVPDPCPSNKRQARGVRDGDEVPSCRIPDGMTATVSLSLDPMELGLSPRYGASWRERTQLLLERLGPFQLGYLESLLRAADCRASAEEDECGREGN